MRRKMHLINVLILLGCLPSFGQANWEEVNGFVITEGNVTVKGFLTLEGGDVEQGTKITLIKKPNDVPQIFYALDLKGYAYKEDTFRIIHDLQPYLGEDKIIDRAEAKIISNGKLILYEIPQYEARRSPPPAGSPGAPGMTYQKLYHIYVIRDEQSVMFGIKKDNFQSVMRVIVTDAPDLVAKIDSKSLKFKDLKKIVDEYNQRFR